MTTNEKPEALRLADNLISDELFVSLGAVNPASHELRRLHAENEELRAKLAEAEKDAERYRWLRNESWGCGVSSKKFPRVAETVVIADPYVAITILAESALDAAIDAARKQP
jgi:hypothetical protein